MRAGRTSLLYPRQLEAIVVVAQTHSVHAAARQLGVPQPQLSRLVSAAERTLGLKLFERSRSGMQAAASSSERVIKEAAFALEALRDVSKSARERVPIIRLGCLPRVMHVLIPHLLAEIADRDVGFKLQVSVGTSNEVAAELQTGHVDVVIGRRVAPVREIGVALDADRLYAERTVVVCGHENRVIGSGTVHISQLARHNWLLPKRGFYSRDILDSMVSRAGLPPIVPIIESNSFDSSLSVVAVTRFITIAPEFFARRLERLRLVLIVQMKPSLGSGSLMLQYQPRQRAHPGFDAFRAAVMRAAKKVRASE